MNGDHDEVQVGGPLDETRLRQIMVRGFLFRNLSVSEKDALTYRDRHDPEEVPAWSKMPLSNHLDGETPTICHGIRNYEGAPDPATETYTLHMGCGDMCGVFAKIPYDADMGRAPDENAEAIAHAGRDLIDLTREVIAQREELAALRIAHTELLTAANAVMDERSDFLCGEEADAALDRLAVRLAAEGAR